MGIRYLKGIYNQQQTISTRPRGFEFPVGLNITSPLTGANSANSGTTQTYDLLMTGGGGGGGTGCSGPESPFRSGGGGGGGGIKIVSGNNWNELTEFKNPVFIDQTTNFIPVIIGGASSSTCFGTNNCVAGGGSGGSLNGPGGSGASGGGGGGTNIAGTPTGGCGCFGQGCNGGSGGANPPSSPAGGGTGGSACANASTTGITSTITGTAVVYAGGGPGCCGGNGCPGTANRGNGGSGGVNAGGSGGSGIVAIRYCNPAAPTTPLATGGSTICCTGGCIIHVFTSSGFLNVATTFDIN